MAVNMIGALLFLLVACASGVKEDKSSQARDAPPYISSLADLESSVKLLKSHLNNSNLTIYDPELHYLLVLKVVGATAKKIADSCLPLNYTDLYLNEADEELPKALLDPQSVIAETKGLINLVQDKTAAGAKLIHDTCDADFTECEYLVELIVLADPKRYKDSVQAILDLKDAVDQYLKLHPKIDDLASHHSTIRLIYNDVPELVKLSVSLGLALKDELPLHTC